MKNLYTTAALLLLSTSLSQAATLDPKYPLQEYVNRGKAYPEVCRLITVTHEVSDFLKTLPKTQRAQVSDVLAHLSIQGDPFDISVATHIGNGAFLVSAHTVVDDAITRVIACDTNKEKSLYSVRSTKIFPNAGKSVQYPDIGIAYVENTGSIISLPKRDLNMEAISVQNHETLHGVGYVIDETNTAALSKYQGAVMAYINSSISLHNHKITEAAFLKKVNATVTAYAAIFLKVSYDYRHHDTIQHPLAITYKLGDDAFFTFVPERILRSHHLRVKNNEKFLGEIPYEALIGQSDSGSPIFQNGQVVAVHSRTDYVVEGTKPVKVMLEHERLDYAPTKAWLEEQFSLQSSSTDDEL